MNISAPQFEEHITKDDVESAMSKDPDIGLYRCRVKGLEWVEMPRMNPPCCGAKFILKIIEAFEINGKKVSGNSAEKFNGARIFDEVAMPVKFLGIPLAGLQVQKK